MIWNGDGTAPVSRPPYRNTSRPFCAVATGPPTGLVIAERSPTTHSLLPPPVSRPTPPIMAQPPGGPARLGGRSTYHRRSMANLINVERATVGYGTRALLDAVSLGVEEGDAIGVVGRNGDGKTTLLEVLTGSRPPDSGRVTHTSGLSVGYVRQADDFAAGGTVPPGNVGRTAG